MDGKSQRWTLYEFHQRLLQQHHHRRHQSTKEIAQEGSAHFQLKSWQPWKGGSRKCGSRIEFSIVRVLVRLHTLVLIVGCRYLNCVFGDVI